VEATHLFLYLMEACLAALVMICVSVAVVIIRVDCPERIRIHIRHLGTFDIKAQRSSHAHHISTSRGLE